MKMDILENKSTNAYLKLKKTIRDMGHSLNPLRVASQKLEMPTSITKAQIEIFININIIQ